MSKLVYSPPPHLKADTTVSRAMLDVIIALLPITVVAIIMFGLNAVETILVCLVAAAVSELAFRKVMNKKPTLQDCSALLTGLLVALCFSASTAWWIAALATFVGVGLGKELMGGLGWNRFNPALLGRVSVILLAPLYTALNPGFAGLSVNPGNVDVVTQGTPLAMLQQGDVPFSYLELFTWFPGGAMAEISPLALLIGAGYLFFRGHINWRIPVSILATVAVLSLVLGHNPIHHLLIGGIMLGAFFMATDWVTSPITDKGKIVFGVAIGILLVVFRLALAPVEGMAFAILIMNAFVPLIEKMTRRPSFSEPKQKPAAAGKGVAG